MVKVTPITLKSLNVLKYINNSIYKNNEQNSACPINRNETKEKIDNSVASNIEFELL